MALFAVSPRGGEGAGFPNHADSENVGRWDRLGYQGSALGDRLGIDALRYNRTIFRMYDRLATNDAPAVADAILGLFPDAETIVDVGAGSGAYAAELASRGKRVVALERSRIGRGMAESRGVDVRPFDLRRIPSPIVCDLAYSFEVAEHIPRELAVRYVTFLCACAPIVFLTAAPPGQGGTGHLNEQPRAYWVDLFAAAGAFEDEGGQAQLDRVLPLQRLSAHWGLTERLVLRVRAAHRRGAA